MSDDASSDGQHSSDDRLPGRGRLMWPWTHLAVGYLLVSLVWRLDNRRVDGLSASAVAFGTQFPDLVDKPLAWSLGVLPAGRSLAHSVVTAAVVSAVVLSVAARRGRRVPAAAFVGGYLSHLAGDALPKLPAGDFDALTFLLWPLLPLPEYEGAAPAVGGLAEVAATPAAYLLASPLRLAALLAVLAVWCADGFPVAAAVGRYLTRRLGANAD